MVDREEKKKNFLFWYTKLCKKKITSFRNNIYQNIGLGLKMAKIIAYLKEYVFFWMEEKELKLDVFD